MDNLAKNKAHYDTLYADVDVDNLVDKVLNAKDYIETLCASNTSWYGLYSGGLQHKLSGLRILELGAGNGLNALLMVALGAAHVIAIDISDGTRKIIEEAAQRLDITSQVDVRIGDFAGMSFEQRSFDLIVGKAFLHHLTHEVEEVYLKHCARILRFQGEARFFEPAINSKVVDSLRWLIPVPGRPSRLNHKAFREWKLSDPHPQRDNSSQHYQILGSQFFRNVEITPIGGIERFYRLLPSGPTNQSFRRAAFVFERTVIPRRIHSLIARSQLIKLYDPIEN